MHSLLAGVGICDHAVPGDDPGRKYHEGDTPDAPGRSVSRGCGVGW
jgi:hypothetical protein